MIRHAFLLSLLVTVSFAMPDASADPTPQVAGFERGLLADGTDVGIWFPATGMPERQRLGLYAQEAVLNAEPVGKGLGLIVMSHGSGGDFAGHLDTAQELAKAGFVVAALTHPGDNWKDGSRATQIEKRPAALGELISHMLGQWRFGTIIDPARIGAFGFSSGGFTVLAATGGKPDLALISGHCAAHPDFFDCKLMNGQTRSANTWPSLKDDRIKAIVVAAPALGFAFSRAGLRDVMVPIQLWRAGNDRILPAPFYADAVRDALPVMPEFHDVQNAGHFDFLAPCANSAPLIPVCASTPGFDRPAFHQRFNADVVRFFQRSLR